MKSTHRRSGAVAAAAMLVTAFFTTAADAASCAFETPRRTAVNLQRQDGSVQYDNRHSRAQLAQLQRRTGQSGVLGAAWTPVGLTLTELKYDMRVRVEALRVGPNSFCARLAVVEATLGYDRLNVYIARRFRPGTCAYGTISDHEMTHVAVFRRALQRYYPRMQRRLDQAAATMKPIRAATPNQAAVYLQRQLRSAVDPLFREMNRTVDRENARLDTPERYRREQARCQAW